MVARVSWAVAHHLSQLTGQFLPPQAVADYEYEDHFYDWTQREWLEFFNSSAFGDELVHEKVAAYFTALSKLLPYNFNKMRELGAQYLLPGDRSYPFLLSHIPFYPLGLFVKGPVRLLQKPSVAVVGSRRASQAGLKMAERVGEKLSERGYLVVSGGAFGCDMAAHLGTTSARVNPSSTVVVFACGLDELYPKAHLRQFKQILEQGGVWLSEFMFGVKPRKNYFRVRNRIISGMSRTTILIEADSRSGSLLTANQALEQGRDVIVLKCKDPSISRGTQELIDDGAQCFDSVQDLQRLIG